MIREPLGPEMKRVLLSMDLNEPDLRMFLAAWLATDIAKYGSTSVNAINYALDRFVKVLPEVYDKAMEKFERGEIPSVDLGKILEH